MICHYYEELFGSSRSEANGCSVEGLARVTRIQNQALHSPITTAKVKKAVFAMHPDKAPDPDGLNPGFYQHHWDIIGADIVRCQDGSQRLRQPQKTEGEGVGPEGARKAEAPRGDEERR
ncbi:unnamed protein product [Cuscuta europaea]|uniref:Uncharacterized protein n=1 Tax=Cuscuta europaea TaxID=41803 RepID=A0A9P0ZFS6_CUSEU|nr:unnamed protein product [Cuscuta europaea]